MLEQITGATKARQEAKKLLLSCFAVSVAVAGGIFVTGPTTSSVIALAVGTLFAGIPFGILAQRVTLSLSLSREQLRLKRFLIGKKGYVGPKNHVLHDHADLFAIASNLVCYEKFLAPASSAAAWHTYGVLTNAPAVAACIGWYGDNQPVVFMYGGHQELVELATDVWDLGHVRRKGKGDVERFSQTAAGWKHQQLIPVALAYAPLPANADPSKLSTHELAGNCILLGAVGVTGSLGNEQTIAISPDQAVKRSTSAQAVITLSLVFYAGLSVFTARSLDQPPTLQAIHLFVFNLFLSPLLLAVYSWDRPSKAARKRSFSNLAWTSLLIACLGLGSALLYRSSISSLDTAHQPIIQSSIAAVGILTFGLCLLLQLAISRTSGKFVFRAGYNPLFLLASASSLLVILIVAYGTGPLLLGGSLLAIGASLLFCVIHEIKAYADRHHTRDHLVELLKTSTLH